MTSRGGVLFVQLLYLAGLCALPGLGALVGLDCESDLIHRSSPYPNGGASC